MLETSARLLRLLSLLQSRRDWTGADLAGRLGVGLRTVRRDIDRLRDLGYPVDATPGAAGGYRLGTGAALPPLLLDDEEVVAVAISLHTATTGSVAGLEETALRALTKLQQMLPSRLRHRISAFHATTVALAGPGSAADRVDPDLLTTLAAACRDQRRLRLRYPGRDGETTREVEPHRLVHTPRRWYLVAWDLSRGDWRTFRVDRIQGPPGPPGARFTPRPLPAQDVAAYVSQSIASAPYRYQARILFRAPLAEVAERTSPAAGRLEAAGPDTCVLHTGSNSLDELALYVGLKGFDFEVLDPPELIGVLRSLSGRLFRGATQGQVLLCAGSGPAMITRARRRFAATSAARVPQQAGSCPRDRWSAARPDVPGQARWQRRRHRWRSDDPKGRWSRATRPPGARLRPSRARRRSWPARGVRQRRAGHPSRPRSV